MKSWQQKAIIGDATLYLGDCESILAELDSVDAIVMDPPYVLSEDGPGKSHFGMSLNKFDSDDYKKIVNGFDLEKIFGALELICNPFNLFCFCSNKQISQIMTYHESKGRSTNLLVWHKLNATPFANGVWRNDLEFCIHARSKGAYFEGNARQKTKYSAHPALVDKHHPTVKPLPIVEKYIQICSDRNHTILDPFMGLGTTGIGCLNLGRKFIGIEIEKKYFNLACERLDQVQRQGRLFTNTIAKPEQEKLLLVDSND